MYKIVKESINFERGKDPLDSMNIGLKNNPIRIDTILIDNLYIAPKEGKDILQKISKSKNVNKKDDIWFFEAPIDGEGEIYLLNDIKGKWIIYDSILYHIPIK
jgi:hypothetical protein